MLVKPWPPARPHCTCIAVALNGQSCLDHVCIPVTCNRSLRTSTADVAQMIGHAGQAPNPGDYFTGSIADLNYVVVRGDDNQLRAFHNVSSSISLSFHASRNLSSVQGMRRERNVPSFDVTPSMDGPTAWTSCKPHCMAGEHGSMYVPCSAGVLALHSLGKRERC